jgi:hypothetical protein
MDYGQQSIRACANEYGRQLDAGDEHAEKVAEAEMAIWRLLANSPDDAAEWVDAHGPDMCQGENAFGRIAHFAGFMRSHGSFDAATLAAIGARVVAELEALVKPAAEAV